MPKPQPTATRAREWAVTFYTSEYQLPETLMSARIHAAYAFKKGYLAGFRAARRAKKASKR